MSVLPKSFMVLGARLQTVRTALRLRQKKSGAAAQKRAFRTLVRSCAKTAFGRAAGIEGGMTYAQVQRRVPVHTYADLAPRIADERAARPTCSGRGSARFMQ